MRGVRRWQGGSWPGVTAHEFRTASGVRLRPVAERPGDLTWLLLPGGPGSGSESLLGLAEAIGVPDVTWLCDLPGDGSHAVGGDPFAHRREPGEDRGGLGAVELHLGRRRRGRATARPDAVQPGRGRLVGPELRRHLRTATVNLVLLGLLVAAAFRH
jgi:hypothetical protein